MSKRTKKNKPRKMGIRGKIILASAVSLQLLVSIMGIQSFMYFKNEMVKMGVEEARTAAKISAKQIDGDILKDLKPGDESSDEYQQILQQLRTLKEDCNIKYLYTMYSDGNNLYYCVDSDESASQSNIGDEYEESYEDYKDIFNGKPYVQNYICSTEYGDTISAYEPIYDSNHQVVAILGSDYNAEKIVAQSAKWKNTIISTGLVGLVVTIFLLTLTLRAIMRGIRSVNNKLYELVHNEGDLTQTLDIKTGDEMEVMADNVNQLLKYIREIMKNISTNSMHLYDSTKSVLDDINDSGAHIEDVSATMEEMSAAMEETTASLERVNETVINIYARINTISEEAAAGNISTNQIKNKAQQIHSKAKSEQQQATLLAKDIEASVKEKIQRSKSVEEINILTENILQITEQTSLLALNASIEAARAGETGRGFAVVASEIGNLASSSAESAEQIRQVSNMVISAVEDLALDAERMITFMKETAMEGYQKLLDTSDGYANDADEIHKVIEKFANESEEIEIAMDQIKEAVQAVSIAVEENTKGVCNTAELSSNLNKNIENIEEKADTNMNIAQQLENEVNKFKLE